MLATTVSIHMLIDPLQKNCLRAPKGYKKKILKWNIYILRPNIKHIFSNRRFRAQESL